MRVFIALALVGLLASTSLAGVSVHVYRADEITPLPWADPNVPDVYQDIMVGTHLTLFIGSDTEMPHWDGGLWISWEDWGRGTPSGRGYNEQTHNCEGSILETSGIETHVSDILPNEAGVRISLRVLEPTVGEWIVLDYHAEAIGMCSMGLFAYELDEELPGDFDPNIDEVPPAQAYWVQGLSFHHVASRDHNEDDIVNFEDFAILAGQWRSIAPADPNVSLAPDLNADDVVDCADLILFCDYWLQRTDIEEPESDPNTPEM